MVLYISLSQMADQGGDHFKHEAGLSLREKRSISSPVPYPRDLYRPDICIYTTKPGPDKNLIKCCYKSVPLTRILLLPLEGIDVYLFGDLHTCVYTHLCAYKHTLLKNLAQHPERLSRDEILVTLNSGGKMQVKSYRRGRREALNTKRDGSPARGIRGSLPDHRSSGGSGLSHPPRSNGVKVGTGQEPDGIWICIFIRKARIKPFWRLHSESTQMLK